MNETPDETREVPEDEMTAAERAQQGLDPVEPPDTTPEPAEQNDDPATDDNDPPEPVEQDE